LMLSSLLYLSCSAARAQHGHKLESQRRASLSPLMDRLPSSKRSSAYEYTKASAAALASGDLKQAVKFAGLAIGKDPNLALPYIVRGYAFSEMDEPQRTIADLSKAQQLDPTFKDPRFYDRRALAYVDLENWDLALVDTKQAIAIASKATLGAWRYEQLGQIYQKLQQYPAAIKAFSEGLKVNPKDEGIFRARGRCYSVMRRYKEAIADYTAAIQLVPNPVSYGCRAQAYALIGRDDLAAKDRSSCNKKGFLEMQEEDVTQLLKP